MATPVIMPKFGMAQETGTIVEWLAKEGDQVSKGDVLLRVETDKVVMEVESPGDGLLAGIKYRAGDEVPVTEVIAYLLAPGEEPPGPQPASATPAPTTSAPPSTKSINATPVARRMAQRAGVSLSDVAAMVGYERRLGKEEVQAYLAQKGKPVTPAVTGQKVRATPAARRASREHNVPLTAVPGSGPRGRIQEKDVLRFAIKSPEVAPVPGPREIVPLTGMRKTIARRMQGSYQTVPHVTFTLDVDMSQAIAMRDRLQAEVGAETKISMTAVLVKAVAWALGHHRWMNAQLVDDEIHLLSEVNIGVAVALDEGLIVPVVRGANAMGITQIAAAVNDLARRARANQLTPDEVTGGTFTISNLGMFGIDQFTAIINPPETGILAVGRIARRFVPDENDQPITRPMMTLTLSADHRVVDGATAARFLHDVKRVLEEPLLLLV